MGLILDLVKAKRRIKELEEEVYDLQQQLSIGAEKPSPADIVPQASIVPNNDAHKYVIDMNNLNIPFTSPPKLLNIMEIPDTNSMDGIFDMGNNNLYIEPADQVNHGIMVDWLAQKWLSSQGLTTVDCVYRIMVNEADDPRDFTKSYRWYAIHRLVEVGTDEHGRFFWFAGVNNLNRDPYPARDKNILFLNTGTIY